jgi:hypothetical protein
VILVSYRSLAIAVLLTASLAGASLAALAFQALAGIAIDVNTLPVQAIGVGLGVDYALYLVDRVLEERPNFATRIAALQHSLRTTGLATGFTASTLVVLDPDLEPALLRRDEPAALDPDGRERAGRDPAGAGADLPAAGPARWKAPLSVYSRRPEVLPCPVPSPS